ncbi:RNA-binding protein 44 isoform X3 [Silurus meridionalis]|uniref:RNA-binding protein 44 isoform X3 n=1 Tax=Silurus meridionalis TaxID=175797 RepID=UPI001EE9F1A9|nr:RNA-binding protein 44 isoform X3 [Silurus meridionalis]
MWCSPSVMVPVYLEPSARRVMWPVIPFEQHVWFATNDTVEYQEHCLSVDNGRKFLLCKSVYDLVKISHFMELNDPKLLGWYFSLPAEDRKLMQEEGGLHQFLKQHPALEVHGHIVHLKQLGVGNCQTFQAPEISMNLDGSRRVTFYGMLQCANCGTSCPSGAKKCRCCNTLLLNPEENVCISEDEKTLQLLPSSVREELNLIKAKGHVSKNDSLSSHQLNCIQRTSNNLSATQSNLLNRFQQTEHPRMNNSDGKHFCQMWEEQVSCKVQDIGLFKDSSAQASISLDRELEMQDQNPSSDYDQVSLLPDTNSGIPNLEKETLPEFYSFNSTTIEHTSAQLCDVTDTSMMATESRIEAFIGDEPADCGADKITFHDSVSTLSNSSEWTDLTEDCHSLSNEDEPECEAEKFHSVIVEEASNSTDCIPCINPSCSASGQCTQEVVITHESYISSASPNDLNVKTTTPCEVSPFPPNVSQAVDVSTEFRACFTATRATEITEDFFVKHCQDDSTDGDSCPVNRATIHTLTSDKNTVTDVYMSDLDAICEEFGKFQMIEEELIHLKEEMARSGPDNVGGPRSEQQNGICGCGAISRAKRAELRLLALQFAMCQQHCWRRFHTSPQGETSLQRIEALPDSMSQTLIILEDNYLKMKRKILIHETLIGDSLPELSFKRPSVLQDEGQTNQADVLKINITGGGHLSKNLTTSQGQTLCDSATLSKTASSERSRDVPASSQQSADSIDTKLCTTKDINSSDAWFDAKEEILCDSQICEDNQSGHIERRDSNQQQKVDASGMKDRCFLLCVSNLPNGVTERDLLLWFAKYHASQVSLSNFSNTGVAIVSVRDAKDLEAAVREMNGRSIQGHTLHVEHIYTSPADRQATCKESHIQLSPAAHKPGFAGKGNNNVSRPLCCSLDKLTNICSTPTASGTCVPQHYGTMGSFDTIMAQLSVSHPQMGRQRIVNALLQLQAKHHGVLSGLPLKDIVEMTSELLTRSTTN